MLQVVAFIVIAEQDVCEPKEDQSRLGPFSNNFQGPLFCHAANDRKKSNMETANYLCQPQTKNKGDQDTCRSKIFQPF